MNTMTTTGVKTFNNVGAEEARAASRVIHSGNPLSGYLGSRTYAGDNVTALEAAWSATFGIGHAVAVNSATSGLLASCMAAEVGPGDEVIVPAYTMSATAAAPRVLGARIVFADIE